MVLVHLGFSDCVLGGSQSEFPGWTPVNVKRLLPPRQSRGNSLGGLASAGNSIPPCWRRSCDYWLRVGANQVTF
ncbi:hypothetical protein EYR27_19105 [Xanthomonas oryzae]|nr:hypothetical protein EYR27_19105 [Xanthomonas oryzae]